MNNGVISNNRMRKIVPVAYDSIAEIILCNDKLKLRGLLLKMVTSGGNGVVDVLVCIRLLKAFIFFEALRTLMGCRVCGWETSKRRSRKVNCFRCSQSKFADLKFCEISRKEFNVYDSCSLSGINV